MNSEIKYNRNEQKILEDEYKAERASYIAQITQDFKDSKKKLKDIKYISKKDFNTARNNYVYWKNKAQEMIDKHTIRELGIVNAEKDDTNCKIAIRENLTTGSDIIVPSYGVERNKENDDVYYYGFESELILKNYKKENGLESAQEVHCVGRAQFSDNIYSDIADVIKRNYTLNEVQKVSQNRLKAKSMVIYAKNRNNEIKPRLVFIEPIISYFPYNQTATVLSKQLYKLDENKNPVAYFSEPKLLFMQGKVMLNSHKAKIDILSDKTGYLTLNNGYINPNTFARFIKLK